MAVKQKQQSRAAQQASQTQQPAATQEAVAEQVQEMAAAAEQSVDGVNEVVEQTETQDGVLPETAEVVEEQPVEAVAPVAEKVSEPVVEEVVQIDTFVDKFELVRHQGTSVQKTILSVLDAYKSKMAPGIPVDAHEQATNQWQLWRALLTVINDCPASEFRETWNIVLAYFNEERNGLFSSDYMFRGAAEWRWNARLLEELHALLNLISLTRDRSTRDVGLKQVDIGRTLSESYTQQGRQKMLAYYGK